MSFTLLLAQSDRIVINWETSINQEVCKSVIAWIFITASLLLKLILKLVHPKDIINNLKLLTVVFYRAMYPAVNF